MLVLLIQNKIKLFDLFFFLNKKKGCGLPALNPNVDLHTINTRIMNGKEALPHSWPYAISIAFEGPKGKLFKN